MGIVHDNMHYICHDGEFSRCPKFYSEAQQHDIARHKSYDSPSYGFDRGSRFVLFCQTTRMGLEPMLTPRQGVVLAATLTGENI